MTNERDTSNDAAHHDIDIDVPGPEEAIAADDSRLADPHYSFRKGLESLLNQYSRENNSNTPDFILADYLAACLKAFDDATCTRAWWWRGTDSGKTVPPDKIEELDLPNV